MKFSRFFVLSLVAAAVLVSGCKKDKKEESKLYMNGSIVLPLDKYMEPLQSKTFNVDTLSTLYLNEAGGIGYFYKLPLATSRDTIKTADGSFKIKEFTVVAPDSLDTFSAIYGGFADGYWEQSVTSSFAVVRRGLNGKASLTNFDIADTDKTFTDSRDGKVYYYSNIEGLDWMRQNLAWDGAGYPEEGAPVIGEILGRYYTWEEAQTACPEGWRLPTDQDWVAVGKKYGTFSEAGKDIKDAAGNLMEDVYFNRDRMWQYWKDVKVDNAARFSALPLGYATVSDGAYKFEGKNSYAMFWTSDTEDDMGAYRYIFEAKDDIFYGLADKTGFAVNVRCVR